MPEAVIVATGRTPIGRANKGSLVECRPDDLAALVIREVLAKVPNLDPQLVEDVILGSGQPAGEAGYNIGRVAAVLAGLPDVPGVTVNRYCSSSLQTRAVRDGDEYVINGQKIYTSLAGDADYIWLATRTDPEASKHKGISMFVVPMDSPGIKVVPMHLLGDHNINYTFYEDVRVPAANLVGGENQGWTLITNQLNHERVTLCSSGIIERAMTDVRAWAQSTKLADGRRVIDQEWVQVHLARIYARLEFLKLINWKVAWTATQGHLDVADASTIKVFGTEFYLEAFKLMMEIVGQAGYLSRGSPEAVLAGRLEMYARGLVILTFGGGTNEIQRDLIAIFGLGMPRSLR